MTAMDVNALFLGPKAENKIFFKEMLGFLMDDHMQWRIWFHPDDPPVVTPDEQQSPAYLATLQRTREALIDLAGNLQVHSVPWFFPRYLGHMNADTLMAANLGYMLALLYNPNNCAYEGSPATRALEIEVGKQLARMLGYDPQKAWGHITSGGTIANYEGVWIARNLKSVPLAIRALMPELVAGLDEWQLLNLSSSRILDLVEQVQAAGKLDALRAGSVRGKGMPAGTLGKILVPQSRHYYWSKAVDILGIGQENLILVPVRDDFRMDTEQLQTCLEDLVSRKIPILAVVGVVGTTEEGTVDAIHEILNIRAALEARGVSFYLHIDAAYGGYARTIFLDDQGQFMELETLLRVLHAQRITGPTTPWPSLEVYAAFRAMAQADSITIDPRKMDYVPYAAGAIVLKDRRVLELISYFAAYVFEKAEENPLQLGSYIMEGSKAGATAAAVWMAHRAVPLDVTGYGRIMGSSIEGAHRFYQALMNTPTLRIQGRHFKVQPLVRPDFNMVDFAFLEAGEGDLERINALNQRLYEHCSCQAGPVYAGDFITSKTTLSHEEYGDAPWPFVARMGIERREWDRVHSVYVLRSCVLTPCLVRDIAFEAYWDSFLGKMRRVLEELCLQHDI